MAIVKEQSYLLTSLLSMQELKVMSGSWNPKRLFYQREVDHRKDIVMPFLTTFTMKIYYPENALPTKREQMYFTKQKISDGVYTMLFHQNFGKIHYDHQL